MKLLLVTLFVAIFVATSSGRATPRSSLREILLSIPLKELDEAKTKYATNIKCVAGIMDEIFGTDAELKKLWEETKTNIERIADDEVKKCLAIGDDAEHKKCKEALIKNGADLFFEFASEFNTPPRQAMIKELRKKFLAKCFDIKAIVSVLLKLRSYHVLESLPEIFTDYASIVGDISKSHGLEDRWSKVDTALEPHLDKWNKCSAKTPILAAYCHVTEGRASIKLVADYTDEIGGENPQVMTDILNEVRKRWFG